MTRAVCGLPAASLNVSSVLPADVSSLTPGIGPHDATSRYLPSSRSVSVPDDPRSFLDGRVGRLREEEELPAHRTLALLVLLGRRTGVVESRFEGARSGNFGRSRRRGRTVPTPIDTQPSSASGASATKRQRAVRRCSGAHSKAFLGFTVFHVESPCNRFPDPDSRYVFEHRVPLVRSRNRRSMAGPLRQDRRCW